MTYQDFIDRVNEKLRDDEAWPDSAGATEEQVYLAFIAALAVGSVLPISKFPSSLITDTTLTGTQVIGRLQSYPFPSTVFRYRDDFGIRALILDDVYKSVDGQEPYESLVNLAQSDLYSDTPLFNVDFAQRLVFAINAETVEMKHLAEFTNPKVAGISDDYPLEGTFAERAASIVSYHVSGETIRDSAMAQFQAILAGDYGQSPQAVAAESES